MTEIPEPLLKRAQAARAKAANMVTSMITPQTSDGISYSGMPQPAKEKPVVEKTARIRSDRPLSAELIKIMLDTASKRLVHWYKDDHKVVFTNSPHLFDYSFNQIPYFDTDYCINTLRQFQSGFSVIRTGTFLLEVDYNSISLEYVPA